MFIWSIFMVQQDMAKTFWVKGKVMCDFSLWMEHTAFAKRFVTFLTLIVIITGYQSIYCWEQDAIATALVGYTLLKSFKNNPNGREPGFVNKIQTYIKYVYCYWLSILVQYFNHSYDNSCKPLQCSLTFETKVLLM